MAATLRATETSRSRTNLGEEIIDLVTTRGKLQIDTKTSEAELAELLGFPDRTPILRETLALLTRDGIIVQKPKAGHWIRRVPLAEAREIIRIRAGVEKLVPPELVSREDPDKRLVSVRAVIPELEKSMHSPAAFAKVDGHFRCA